jgi:hypothetical protein
VPSSYHYPVEKHRDLQRRWDRLFQRTAAPNDIYRRAVDQRATKPIPAQVPSKYELGISQTTTNTKEALGVDAPPTLPARAKMRT